MGTTRVGTRKAAAPAAAATAIKEFCNELPPQHLLSLVLSTHKASKTASTHPFANTFPSAVAWRTRGEGDLRGSDGIGVARHPGRARELTIQNAEVSRPNSLLGAGVTCCTLDRYCTTTIRATA